MHAVEDFLISRFSWYSQIVRGSGGARFDILAETVAKHLLEKRKMFQFQELLQMVEDDPDRFFGFNDFYFMNILHKEHIGGKVKDPKIREMIEMLLYRRSPIEVHAPIFAQRLLQESDEGEKRRKAIMKQIQDVHKEFSDILKTKGDGSEWILLDIPDVDVSFAKRLEDIVSRRSGDNLLQERDPVKIVSNGGHASLLVDKEDSLMRILAQIKNFIPSFYMNEKAYELLEAAGAIQALMQRK